ncbi:hypothetical protein CP981_11230 [Streptomyces platensis]|uniref:Uncharacterized protein n=1 Tax=Streptomyces platensis TaxID=58346 RepID=A0AAE6NG98_STRPT|nr:hypothetical protein [Streptomyces platensis]OSY35962.1 hypothetical protein BG653_06987 [Streptomyces platensis]QEV52162.1 hypothetical protein CP981_11230 [Streptomyces platensis]
MPLTPLSYTEISQALDHTDICRLLDADTTRLLTASNTPAVPRPRPAAELPDTQTASPRPAGDPADLAAIWQHIREEEHRGGNTGQSSPQPPAWARPAPPAAPAVPAWVWRYSALALSTGGAVGLAGWGIGQTAAWGPYLETALYTLAVIAVGGAACAMAAASLLGKVIGAIRARLERPHITQHITANGWFGRANGTINHR